jgi:transposase
MASIVRRRRRAVRRLDSGEPASAICADLGCSRASLYRWRQRYRAGGLVGLLDRSRRGRPSSVPPTVERLIVIVRLLPYWNSRRLAAEFSRREIWPLSHGQVDRILARCGTHRPSLARQPGPRYERSAPNELWHIDLKGPFYFRGTARRGSCHFAGLVDDHSRYLLGIRAVPTRQALPILELLHEAVELCGVPLQLMTDNGTPFVAIVRSMLSRFQRSLDELAIRHIRTQIDTPWTNGKIEATGARPPFSCAAGRPTGSGEGLTGGASGCPPARGDGYRDSTHRSQRAPRRPLGVSICLPQPDD